MRRTGDIIPFGGIERPGEPIRWYGERYHPKSHDTHPRSRWRDGVLSILGTDAPHGLRHAYLELRGFYPVTTYATRREKRFFDHLLVSEHFKMVDARYYQEWRTLGLSDHAAGRVKLKLR